MPKLFQVFLIESFLFLVRLLQSFRHWRKKAQDAHTERICMEKARWHHESTVLFKAMRGWKDYHSQYHKNKVVTLSFSQIIPLFISLSVHNIIVLQIMKRQGNLLLRLKVYQKYFEQWKTKVCCCTLLHNFTPTHHYLFHSDC